MHESDEDDDLAEPVPPTADRVARRALVLAAVACRSAIEGDATNPRAEAFRREVLDWLRDAGAEEEAEPDELALLRAPLGSLDERQVIDASWRGEGLGVLAWALGRYELPSYQHTVTPPEVADRLGFMTPDAALLVQHATLRDAEELEALASRLLAVHWRLRDFSLRPVHMDFASFAPTAWFGPLDVTGLEFAGGDLAIDGRPLMDVGEARWRECMSIVRERQQAANWLCGQQTLYSEVSCDT